MPVSVANPRNHLDFEQTLRMDSACTLFQGNIYETETRGNIESSEYKDLPRGCYL